MTERSQPHLGQRLDPRRDQRQGAEPFAVAVPDEVLDDLRARLAGTRWTDTIDGSDWDHGVELGYLRQLVGYWAAGFDWRAQERQLNGRLPGWSVRVGGLQVHYARLRGRGPNPLPLVLLHGWPGTFAEFAKVAPMLADPGAYGADPADAFEVIVPSLPGHGFSQSPPREGFGADECADLVRRLMTDVLGFGRFGAQGGDRGAFVATGLGHRHSDVVAGIHLNLAGGVAERPPSEEDRAWLADQARWLAEEGGYMAVQGTRPQTLAVALNDSPAGLLSWIVDKWRSWSDCGGDPASRFSADEVLTNATLYWVSGTIRSSMHWYLEHRRRPPAFIRPVRVDVPTAVASFPAEVMRTPRSAVERKYQLRQWTEMARGGHFAAMEEPVALVEDVRRFFRPLRGAAT